MRRSARGSSAATRRENTEQGVRHAHKERNQNNPTERMTGKERECRENVVKSDKYLCNDEILATKP